MSSATPIIASTVGASAAAARARKEEEEMTNYNADDLDGWEFKIMRSTWGSFGNREKLQVICEEEARAGWEMVEKFDNYRVRFKRRVEKRSTDQHLAVDPYRTSPGGSGSYGKVFLIMGATLALMLGIYVVGTSSGGLGFGSGSTPWVLIMVGGLSIIGLGLAVMFKKR